MASETAIIATRVGDIPEMLALGKAGILVDPRDPSGLARAIEGLLAEREERERLGHNARTRVEEEYDQSRLVRSLLVIYEGAHRPTKEGDPAGGD
jgi:starch synthase